MNSDEEFPPTYRSQLNQVDLLVLDEGDKNWSMPGVHPGDMNGFDYDRGGPVRGSYPVNGVDPYGRDEYRDEMRREEDGLYRRPMRNGQSAGSDRFRTDHLADQQSLSDFNSSEPIFELDHLATFAAGGSRKGIMHVEDGLRKLRQMENTTGIWTMRCILLVERRYIVIIDKQTGEELERFPVNYIQEPTAIFKNDRREIYNNLILFTVLEETNRKDAQADMHIFQSVRIPAQVIVDEIVAAKKGHGKIVAPYKIPPPPQGPAPEPPRRGDPFDFQGVRDTLEYRRYDDYNQYGASQYGVTQFGGGAALIGGPPPSMMRPSYSPYRDREDFEGGANDLLERDVQLLNHCFDDIERFVARLQQAAEAYKELDKRRRDRGAKGKKRQAGEGMLSFRARPPPAGDFVDIFQKFKLSFNLLAKLKAHIHDPNAPELVHFLFTPLSLIYEASRDPVHGRVNLAEQAVAPVLTQDAKQLLLNCLTSKEIELWQALGKNWTVSKDEWKGMVPPYVPRFFDGWQPAPVVANDVIIRGSGTAIGPAILSHTDPAIRRVAEESRTIVQHERIMPYQEEDRFRQMEEYIERPAPSPRIPTPPRNREYVESSIPPYHDYVEQHVDRKPPEVRRPPEPVNPPVMVNHHSRGQIDDNQAYLQELRRSNAIIYEVLHDRQGKNPKELTVNKGDILQVLDSNRNWWKVRNFKGETGFCPYTILKEIGSGGGENSRDITSSVFSTTLEQTVTALSQPLTDGRKVSKRGEFKYF